MPIFVSQLISNSRYLLAAFPSTRKRAHFLLIVRMVRIDQFKNVHSIMEGIELFACQTLRPNVRSTDVFGRIERTEIEKRGTSRSIEEHRSVIYTRKKG
jgi:hypothetical protein